MERQSTDILKEFELLKGQFIINAFWKIERLIAIASDEFGHKFYVTYDGRKTTWQSYVVGIIPLKSRLLSKEYKALIKSAKTSHYDQHDMTSIMDVNKKQEILEFASRHKEDVLFLYNESTKYITDICWDIN
jgi:hypothetical protein